MPELYEFRIFCKSFLASTSISSFLLAKMSSVSLTHVSVPTADIGLAQLAMHSCYETAGVQDSLYLEKAMTTYFSSTLTVTGDGEYIIV